MENVSNASPQKSQANDDQVSREVLAHETLRRLLPEAQALEPEELMQITVDPADATSTVFGALPKIRAFREAILKSTPGFDMVSFDKLEDYVVALRDAHNAFLSATKSTNTPDNSFEEAEVLREAISMDARNLALRGYWSSAPLDELKEDVGRQTLSTDLGMLENLYRSNWEKIQGKTTVTLEELERASRLSLHIGRLIGVRQQSTPVVAEVADTRARFFTLMMRCYDRIRRALTYLRWEEQDLEKIAPSVFAANRTARRKNTEVVPAPPHPPSDAGTVVPAGAVVASKASTPVGIEAGTPGSEPFLDRE